MNYNRIILVGRLTRDPESRSTPSGVPVTTIGIAVNRPQSAEARQQGQAQEADFFDVIAWRQTAEYVANYLTKGKLVLVEGRVQIRNYTTQDGQQRKAFEVIADNVRMMEKRQDGDGYGDDAGSGMGNSGGRDAYAPAPQRSAAPVREDAPARGGYEPRQNAGRTAQGNAPSSGRSGGRSTPPPPSNDYDDFQDPFDE